GNARAAWRSPTTSFATNSARPTKTALPARPARRSTPAARRVSASRGSSAKARGGVGARRANALGMAKPTTQYSCQACGAVYPKWVGRCTTCSAWNTLVEGVTQKRAGGASPASRASAALPVSAIDADQAARIPTGIGELDRVLGGGVVLGGVTL